MAEITHPFEAGDLIRFLGANDRDDLESGALGRLLGFGADGYVFVRWPDLGVEGWSIEDARRAFEVVRRGRVESDGVLRP